MKMYWVLWIANQLGNIYWTPSAYARSQEWRSDKEHYGATWILQSTGEHEH